MEIVKNTTWKPECYTPITTFWNDFNIAEHFNGDAIIDTYKRAFAEWHSNYKYLVELDLVLNHKIWYWYNFSEEIKNMTNISDEEKEKALNIANEFAVIYNDLWNICDNYCGENLKGDEYEYYFSITD